MLKFHKNMILDNNTIIIYQFFLKNNKHMHINVTLYKFFIKFG
jgi:hypothetical protein